jgi:hypothetical protein
MINHGNSSGHQLLEHFVLDTIPPLADDTPFGVQSLRLGPRGEGEASNDDADIQYARYSIYCAAVFGSKGFQLRRVQPADSTQTLSEPILGDLELGITRNSHLLEGQNTVFDNSTMPTSNAAHRDLCSVVLRALSWPDSPSRITTAQAAAEAQARAPSRCG